MIGTAVLLEWHAGRLPWAALAIPLRDVLLLAVTPTMLARGYRFEVNLLGKAATWLLYLGVGCSMVTHPRRTGRSGSSGPASRSRSRRSCCTPRRPGER